MTLLVRYILKTTLTIFFVSLSIMTILIGFFFVTRIAITLGAPLKVVIAMFPFMIPEIFSFAIPAVILLTVSIVFGKMAGSNEIMALKAIGIPPWRSLLPIWIFVFLLSFFVVWMNDLAVSWGRQEISRVFLSGMESIVMTRLAEDGKFSSPDGSMMIEAGRVDATGQLFDVYVAFKGDIRGTASRARLEIDYKTNPPVMRTLLHDARFETEKGRVIFPGEFAYDYAPGNISNSVFRCDPPMSKIPEELEKIEQERRQNRRRLATMATFGFVTGNYDSLKDGQWIHRRATEEMLDGRRNRCLLATPRRWASGFACFFFVWVGAPLAIRINRSDYLTSFFACFIPILLIYYPLLLVGFQGVKNGTLHPAFAWLGNLVLGVVGCILLKQIHRN